MTTKVGPDTPVRLAGLLALLGSLCSVSLAAAPEVSLALQPEHHLTEGEHTAIEVVVQLPSASPVLPVLLTPRIEGAAVELARGRLLRGDAKPVDETHLRFELPVVARSLGTAILRVTVRTYICDTTCRHVDAAASAVIDVRGGPPSVQKRQAI
jgi:hypothetical protein